jgi:glycosyltransferase involved in cell wall biosynthesis
MRAVRSILMPADADIQLFVIDQSDGTETEQALRGLSDPRLTYVRTAARGKGAALNEGLRLAQDDIVVCTDDDCEAPPDWVAAMARELRGAPDAMILFCNVVAGPFDPGAGYVPVFVRSTDRVMSSLSDAGRGIGLGAGMALRRDAILALGGFDETFGPGARFGSGDDWDISVRALIAGGHVVELSRLSIVHYGFRTFAEGRHHALRDWIAIGALCAKPIRAGHFSAVGLGIRLFSFHALWPPLRDVMHLRRPSGASRIVGFIKGFVGGLATPVEPTTLRFRSTP